MKGVITKMKYDKEGHAIINNTDDFKAWLETRKNKKLYDVDANGRVIVDHIAVANVLAKFIELCPMDRWIKKVMLMRVGNPLMNNRKMTHMQIAIIIGATVDEVIELENAGKIIVGRFLQHCSAQEAVDKFNSNSKLSRNVDDIKNKLIT